MTDTESKKKDLARSKAKQIQLYSQVFDCDEGREVLLDLMGHGFILRPTLGNSDRETALNEGKRELVLYILDMVTYDVSDIVDIIGNTTRKRKETRNEEKEEFDFFKD